jgi:sialate O-acetylesterase
VYGRNLVAHGPRLESWTAEAGKAVLKFSSVGGGLVARSLQLGGHSLSGDKLEGFELAGADRKLVRAEARVVGNDTLVIESPEVRQPVAVRYAWGAFPLCNLFNQEGFPAYPFRTDSWPWKTPADVPPAKNIERAAIPGPAGKPRTPDP